MCARVGIGAWQSIMGEKLIESILGLPFPPLKLNVKVKNKITL